MFKARPGAIFAGSTGIESGVCCVVEDSFSGVAAGRNAGTKVIGLVTTNPKEKMEGMVDWFIHDFAGYRFDDFIKNCL